MSPVGTVIGAVVLTLVGSVLSFLDVSSDWQIGAQGMILLFVLGAPACPARRALRYPAMRDWLRTQRWLLVYAAALAAWAATAFSCSPSGAA